jgi:hypothetical protein
MKIRAANDEGERREQPKENPHNHPATATLQTAGRGFAVEPNRNCLFGVGQASTQAAATSDDKCSDTKRRRGRKGDPKLPEERARRPHHFLHRQTEHAGEEEDEAYERRNWHSQMGGRFHMAERTPVAPNYIISRKEFLLSSYYGKNQEWIPR